VSIICRAEAPPGSYVVDADHTAISGIMDCVQCSSLTRLPASLHNSGRRNQPGVGRPGRLEVVADVNYRAHDSETTSDPRAPSSTTSQRGL